MSTADESINAASSNNDINSDVRELIQMQDNMDSDKRPLLKKASLPREAEPINSNTDVRAGYTSDGQATDSDTSSNNQCRNKIRWLVLGVVLVCIVFPAVVIIFVAIKKSGNSVQPCSTIGFPVNGNGSCVQEENVIVFCTFSCMDGFTLVGNEVTFCNNGNWNSTAPTCERMCSPIQQPLNGNISCVKETNAILRCNFSCIIGYVLKGNKVIFCTEGKWNGISPTCNKALTCPNLPKVEHGEIKCSNGYNFNSICNVTCADGRQIQGHDVLTCLNNGTWSFSEPSCVCADCRTGDRCQYSTSWEAVDITLDGISPYSPTVIKYGGHEITCESKLYKWFKFHGICADKEDVIKYECNDNKKGYESSSGSAKHAASKLIKELVKKRKYPKPCDPKDMPTDC